MRWSSVLVSVVPAWAMGTAANSTLPQYFLRAAMRGENFSVFSSNLMSQPRSLQNPISMMMRVHCFLLKEVGSGEGVFGTPLAQMRSGAVPCPVSNNIWVSACGSTQSRMRLGAAVRSASPAVAEIPQGLHLKSVETPVCRLRRISSVVGRGANQSCGMGFEVGV